MSNNSTNFEVILPGFTAFQMGIYALAIFISIFAFILYVTVIGVLAYYKQDFSNPYFVFVKALGIFDLILLTLSLYQAITVLFPSAKQTTLLYIVRLLFVITQFSDALLHLLIAYNRYAAIVLYMDYKLMFTNKKCFILTGTVLFLSILYTIIFQVLSLPYGGEVGVCILGIAVMSMIILYTVAAVMAVKRIRASTVANLDLNKEVKLLIQAVIGTVLLFLMILAALANLIQNNTAKSLSYLFAVIDTVLIPVSYVFSNRRLRMRFRAFIKRLIFKPSSSVEPQNIPNGGTMMAIIPNNNILPPVN